MRVVRYHFVLCFCIFFGILSTAHAQLPPYQPEQDCFQAIPICQAIYHQSQAYKGEGRDSMEINPYISCLVTGEKNSVWYTFTVQQAGNICFSITPNDPQDDYDWALFNLTQASCQDIPQDPHLLVRCNYNPVPLGCNGVTGAMSAPSLACSPASEPCIQVLAGETYVLNVSNYTSSNQGYLLDFSASTASITDTLGPQLTEGSVLCGHTLQLSFSEPVQWQSLQAQDFLLTDSAGQTFPLRLLPGNGQAALVQSIELQAQSSLSIGDYALTLVDTILDKCDHVGQLGQQIHITLTEEAPNLGLSKLRFCKGDSSLLWINTSSPLADIQWSTGSNTDSIWMSPVRSSSISVNGSTLDGCSFRFDTILTVSNKPSFQLIGPDSICTGVVDTFKAFSDQDRLRYHWRLTTGGYQQNRHGSYAVAFTEAGTTQVILTAEDRGCRSDTLFHNLKILPSPALEVNLPTAICLNAPSHSLEIEAAKDISTIEWQIGPDEQHFSGSRISWQPQVAGNQLVSIHTQAKNGCKSSLKDSIQVWGIPHPSLVPSSLCLEEPNQLQLRYQVNTTFSEAQFKWLLPNQDSVIGDHYDIINTEVGPQTFLIAISTAEGCTDTLNMGFEVRALPSFSVSWPDSCPSTETQLDILSPQADHQYIWTLPQQQVMGSSVAYVIPEGPQQISILAKDPYNCYNQVDTLIIPAKTEFASWQSDSICPGGNGEVRIQTVNPHATYAWYADSGSSQQIGSGSIFAVENMRDDFQLFVRELPMHDCPSKTTPIDIPIRPLPNIHIILRDTLLEVYQESFQAQFKSDQPLVDWQWTLAGVDISQETSPSLPMPHTGTYKLGLEVVDIWGCEAKQEIGIRVLPLPSPLVPTAFTPNGDGLNDEYFIHFEGMAEVSWVIRNRWGKVVFTSQRPELRWNGTDQTGNPLPEGVYSLHIIGQYLTGHHLNRQASITLIR